MGRRIAYFEPVESGLNATGCELLPCLREHFEIDVFTDDIQALAEKDWSRTLPVHYYSEFPARRSCYVQTVFQLRNNRHHVPIYDSLLQFRGVAVLHDVNLSGILGAKTLGRGHRIGFLLEVWKNEGLSAFIRTSLNAFLNKRWPGAGEYALNRVVCRRSFGIIVHNEQASRMIRQVAGSVPLQAIPLGVPLACAQADGRAVRRQLGLPEDAFVVISLGYITPRKRIGEALRAFAKLVEQIPQALYVLVGEVTQGFDVQAIVEQYDLGNRVRITGWVDDSTFHDYLSIADVCVNLRYPVEGETSSTALRAMSYAMPTLVSDSGSLAEFPDGVCLKIAPGSGEAESIYRALLWTQSHPEESAALGARAQSFVRQNHTWERAAQLYAHFVAQLAH